MTRLSHLVRLFVVVVVAASLLAGCASYSVTLSDRWPAKPPAYPEASERWKRHGRGLYGVDTAIDVYATLLSPDYRSAWAAEKARRLGLPEGEADALLAEEKKATEETIQIHLLVATHDHSWNDLSKTRSIWRVALVGDDRRVVLPVSIKEDKRKRDELETWFPDMGPFHRAFIATFPRTTPDGQPLVGSGSRALVLQLASPLTALELSWGPSD